MQEKIDMIIDGKAIAQDVQQEIREAVAGLPGRPPCLAVILVGNHAPSQIYVKRKTEACQDVGILSIRRELPPSISEANLLQEIAQLNADPAVDGILVQLPLPHHINPIRITQAIAPSKDVDGFHPVNMGKLLSGQHDGFVPCTPLGIQKMLQHCEIEVTGMHAVVLGRSNIVGKPMAALLMQNTPSGNATVTLAHRHSRNLEDLCRSADLIIAAVGQPHFVTENMVKEGAVVIDVGINRVDDSTLSKGYRIVGDVDFENLQNKCAWITPVPGGVGPMTIAMLLSNTLKSFLSRSQV